MSLNTPEFIILHHSLTKDGAAANWNAIRKYHMDTLKWSAIGYHYGIERIRESLEILKGRMHEEPGAHCKQQNMNTRSLGICNIGNFDNHVPSEARWLLTLKLVKSLMKQYNIPIVNVQKHHEFAPYKSCCGLLWDMGKFRAELRQV